MKETIRIYRIDSSVLYKGVVSSVSLKTVPFVNIITMLFVRAKPAALV